MGQALPPTSRDCIHPFERRLRLCDPEVAPANSSWELTVGSSSKEKATYKNCDRGYAALHVLDFGEGSAASFDGEVRLACNYKKSYIGE